MLGHRPSFTYSVVLIFGLTAGPLNRLWTQGCTVGPAGPAGPAAPDVQVTGTYGVSVTPLQPSVSWWEYTNGVTSQYSVVNTGTCTDTYFMGASTTGPITNVTLDATSFTLGAGGGRTVTATYNVTAPGTGTVTVTATPQVGYELPASGVVNVTVNRRGPVVSLAPSGGVVRNVTACVATCFDVVTSYATPPYLSWDVPHSLQLIYRSAQAKPMGTVQVDARDTSSINVTKMSILLKNSQGTSVTFTNGSTEIFYTWTAHPADSNVNRLAAQFDASTLTTGAYFYTVQVRSYASDGTFRETDSLLPVLVANESSSPFGAGWSIAGFQHLYSQAGGVVITDGDGTTTYFAVATCSTGCSYASPDNSTLTSRGGSADPQYDRRYPDGRTFSFHPDGRLAYIQDRFGNQTQFGYNASNLLVSITDPAGQSISLGYTASNKLQWIKDPGGRTDSITIDASSHLTQVKDWAGGLPFQGAYDANHRLLRWTDRRGGSWGAAYDFAGKVAADTAPQVTANGQLTRPVVQYRSIEAAVLINPSSGLGTSTNPGPNVDTAAVRASVTNARGYKTTYALDPSSGAATLMQEPQGRTTTLTRGRFSWNPTRHALPSGHVMNYYWSGPNLTAQVDSTTGRQVNYVYETTYNKITLVWGDVDSLLNHWTNGHLDSTRLGGSSAWTKYTYTSTGRVSTVTDAGGHTTTYYYHSSGFQNTDSVQYTVGRKAYQYDGHGQPVVLIDQMNDTTWVQYDSIGRLAKAIGALHDTTTLTFDALYVTQLRDAKGQTYRFWVNALGWPDSTTDPAGAVTHAQYDLDGNLFTWTNRRGQTLQFVYDSLDRVRAEIKGSDTTKFFLEPAGRYRAVSNRESVDTVWFDRADRDSLEISCRVLATGSPAQCFRVGSTYDLRNLRTGLTVAAPPLWGPYSVAAHYNASMLLDTLANFAGEKATFSYSPERFVTSRTLAGLNNLTLSYGYPWSHTTNQVQLSDATLNGVAGSAYHYDAGGRVSDRFHGAIATPDTSRGLAFDAADNLTTYVDTLHHWTVTNPCTLGIQGETCPATSDNPTVLRSVTYAYDSVGNRKDSPTQTYGVDLGNRLRRWQNFRLDYDVDGNVTRKRTLDPADTTHALRTDSLFWSALSRLDSVHTRDGSNNLSSVVRFGYDGSGRRVRKSTAAGTSRYLWDIDALVMELDTLGNRVAAYTYYPGVEDDPESVLRHDRGDTTYYYVSDHPGNAVVLLSKMGTGAAIENTYSYGPFGDSLGSAGAVPNSLRFAGREYDAETKLYYDRARYYDPALGRFVSEDPVGLQGSLNLYCYMNNDPVNGRDVSGLQGPEEVAAAGGLAVLVARSAAWKAIENIILAAGIALTVRQIDRTGMPHIDPPPPPEEQTPPPIFRLKGRNWIRESAIAVPDVTSTSPQSGSGGTIDVPLSPKSTQSGVQLGWAVIDNAGPTNTTVWVTFSDGSISYYTFNALGALTNVITIRPPETN